MRDDAAHGCGPRVGDIIDLMINENRRVVSAVDKEKERIAHGVEIITQAWRGRIIFVGAGTSGRFGVLEAAEMPRTFGVKPSMVHAIVAGGTSSVFRSRQGVEDDYEEGARAIASPRTTRCVRRSASTSRRLRELLKLNELAQRPS